MNEISLRFVEEETIHNLSHYLPAQNPLKDFVHHNTLHAFQDRDFFTALQESSEIFGYKTFLPLNDFRVKLKNNEINSAILDKIINQKKGENNFTVWKDNVLYKNYDETITPRIGKLRNLWKEKYLINLDKATHGKLFRILCSYLDQGISVWQFPVHKDGFLASIKELDQNGVFSIFSTNRAKQLLAENTSVKELLQILIGEEKYFENYLFDQQFSHPGWSGMIATLESNPTSLLDERKISLKELITFELLLEINTLDEKFGENWEPLSSKVDFEVKNLFEKSEYSEYFEVLAIWQEAFEWTFYNQALTGMQYKFEEDHSKETPKFQALFCMDDRECSFRRHIEKIEPKSKTFGVAAFFNFEFFYQPVNGKFFTKLCPAPVTPKFLIKELPRKKKSAIDFHYNKKSHSLLFGWLISQTLGYTSAFKLFLNIFKPSMSPATSASFKHLNKKSQLVIENTNPNETIEGLQVGFTIEEMANRVEGILKTIGLVENFAPIVYVVGHGATSVNNTHFAGYDCGACSGRPSSVNAKVLSFAANHEKVREILEERGIQIPSETQFLPALHDTTRDEIVFYDEELLSEKNKFPHKENHKTFISALDNNAKERSRRFDTIDSNESLSKIHEKIKNRSVSLFEPRPELNHATNALCVVGRRSVSDHLFLDRRSFMNSFDYKVDPNGDYLAGILNAVAPVGGGINLEYYFSRVDNQKLGAGSKLPHNVMGLIGVANGIDGDLRPGLPSQMIEIHDPLRLLIVAEHYPEIVKYAITKVPATYEWFINSWVNLVAIHPETKELFRFVNGEFESYKPIAFDIKTIENSLEYAMTSSENLNVTLIK
jgi:uncharacterized protein